MGTPHGLMMFDDVPDDDPISQEIDTPKATALFWAGSIDPERIDMEAKQEMDLGKTERLDMARRVHGFITSTGHSFIPSESQIYDLLDNGGSSRIPDPSVVGELVELLSVMTNLCRLKFGNLDPDVYAEIQRAEATLSKATQL